MSKFDDLVSKIGSLRELSKERDRLNLAKNVSLAATTCQSRLATLKRQTPFIGQLLPNANIDSSVMSYVGSASVEAKRLKKLIRKDKFGSEKDISEHIDNLSNIQTAAEKLVNERWARVQVRVKSVEVVQHLAVVVQLSSAELLKSAVSSYRSATSTPPESDAEVQSIKNAWDSCALAVKSSGLEGNVKKMLDGAISGDGDPKLLLESDVSEFLTTHPALWSVLKLKLA